MIISYKNNVKSNECTYTIIWCNILVKLTQKSLQKRRSYSNGFVKACANTIHPTCATAEVRLASAERHYLSATNLHLDCICCSNKGYPMNLYLYIP